MSADVICVQVVDIVNSKAEDLSVAVPVGCSLYTQTLRGVKKLPPAVEIGECVTYLKSVSKATTGLLTPPSDSEFVFRSRDSFFLSFSSFSSFPLFCKLLCSLHFSHSLQFGVRHQENRF